MTDISSKGAPTGAELEKINAYTLSPLKEDEVYTFGLVLCDNETDRDFERFTAESLKALAPMFEGKTGISDHSGSAKDQSARIFETEYCEDAEKRTSAGEIYACIKARAYMPKTEKNRTLIEEIESGIRKETSVSCSVLGKICSVCGEDIRACGHIKGRFYSGKLCTALLTSPADAYEWSFVAVPAQKASGVTKGFEISRFAPAQTDVGALVTLAAQAEQYRLELVKSCVSKLCSLLPGVESSLFGDLLENADAGRVRSLEKALCAAETGGVSRPQFEMKNGPREADNREFKI